MEYCIVLAFEILTEIMILGHETLGNSISILIKK